MNIRHLPVVPLEPVSPAITGAMIAVVIAITANIASNFLFMVMPIKGELHSLRRQPFCISSRR
jgi:hypothetical protein